jgi:Fe-Mn family superoxide dismutase
METLIKLPYELNALEPVISAQTLSFHHGKHLQTYVDNLNKLFPGSEFEGLSLEEIVAKAPSGPIFNNAGQILNHNLYFTQFSPNPSPAPSGRLAAQIEKQWGSIDAFKADFEAKGTGLFGSGWVWLSADEQGKLFITQEGPAGNPITRIPGSSSVIPGSTHVMPGQTGHLRPLLTFDVWEHAYYLDYQNRRAAHLSALWQIVDWTVMENRYLSK